jgi:hypothetical protein
MYKHSSRCISGFDELRSCESAYDTSGRPGTMPYPPFAALPVPALLQECNDLAAQ